MGWGGGGMAGVVEKEKLKLGKNVIRTALLRAQIW